MYTEPKLTRDEFRSIHNALCELEQLEQSLKAVLNSETLKPLVNAKNAIRQSLARAYDEDNCVFERRTKLFTNVKNYLGCTSIWSIFEVDDMYNLHPWPEAQRIVYRDHWGTDHVVTAVPGPRWIDLYIAADYLIGTSGDTHHMFIEQFTPWQEDNTVLILGTGS